MENLTDINGNQQTYNFSIVEAGDIGFEMPEDPSFVGMTNQIE